MRWLPIIDFAQALLYYELIEQSPIIIEIGYEPRTSFDWKPIAPALSAKEKLNREEAQALTKRLREIWEYARDGVQKA